MPLQFERPRRRRSSAGKGHRTEIVRRRSTRRRASIQDPDAFLPKHKRFAPAPPEHTVLNDRRHPEKNEVDCQHVKLLGEGGQGRCDLFKRKDGMLFVYKLMKYSVEVDSKNKPKEAKIMQDILGSHPRIIQMHHYTWSPDSTVFYLEYCNGGDLAMLGKAYRNHDTDVPESFVWHTYIQLAEALAYIHEGYNRNSSNRKPPKNWQEIVHRDIKPQNVFLRKSRNGYDYPDVVLADFGIATRQLYTCQRNEYFLGTLAYQGPEVPLHSRSGDRWAMGACIHYLCAGGPPISKPPRGVDALKWTEYAEARKVQYLTDFGYSDELEDAMYLVLAPKPYDRPPGKELLLLIEEKYNKWERRRGLSQIPLASWALPR